MSESQKEPKDPDRAKGAQGAQRVQIIQEFNEFKWYNILKKKILKNEDPLEPTIIQNTDKMY